MYTAQMTFRKARPHDAREVADALDTLIVALRRNGQIESEEWPVASEKGQYTLFVTIPERSALRQGLFNRWVKEAFGHLGDVGLRRPSIRVIGPEPGEPKHCRCRRSPSYILTTDFLAAGSPLRCGACHARVPLYRLRHTHEAGTFEDILFWIQAYRMLDCLWLFSGRGERLAYRELSQHDSELSQIGREICRRIERQEKIAAFYFLFRYYGRSRAGEMRRRCPTCGRVWALQSRWHERYDFRCEKCRLVSSIACDIA